MRKIGFLVFLLCVVGASACSARRESPANTGAGEPNTVRADLGRAAKRDFYVYHNDIFPGFLLHTRRNELHLFRGLDKVGLSAPTHLAWSENGRVKVAKAPAQTGARLSAPWILVWFSGGRGWDSVRYTPYESPQSKAAGPIDVPWLVILQRPAVATLSAQGLSVSGKAPLGHVVFMPLFGSQKLRPAHTAGWASGLPKEVMERATQWTAISRRFPLYAREDYQVDEARDVVRIRNTFDYLTINDHWKTAGLTVAPLPPVVALAYTSKFRITFDAPPADLSMVTHWGPYWGVKGKPGYTYGVKGILKYVDEVEAVRSFKTNTPGFKEVKDLLLWRMGVAAKGEADPRQAYSIDWGMGMLGAWMRALKYLPQDLRKQLTAYVQRENLLNGHFLNPDTYEERRVPVSPQASTSVLVVKSGQQTDPQDLVKQTSRMPYVVWQYGYYSGDWKTVRQRYDLVKKMYGFNLLLGWSNVGPEYTAEHAKISAKQGPIGLARLAKQFGDQPTYDYGAYLLAKALINEWAWDVAAVPYMKKHAPWFHSTGGDWIVHQNHGYAGLSALPLDQVKAYQEIPLVLDRFNREELWGYNDHYVRMRHKYIPRKNTANVYVTDLGDAPDLKALLSKPLTQMVTEEALKGQSHLSPIFYNYPVDLMELASEFSYKRLYPKGKITPTWRRGLDALSQGQSWRQMAMAMRKDPGSWPYPGWYRMNPPQTAETFSDDLLPFGYIQADLRRSPQGARFEVRSNWNSDLVAVDLEAAKPAARSSSDGRAYLSDLGWASATSGWGPVERDKSSGDQEAGDGKAMTLNGTTYAKGLGVHAASEVAFDLGGRYATFRSEIGVDDEVGGRGSVVFQVWADGQKLYDSGVMTGDTPTKAVSVRVAGKRRLQLIVTDGGDGIDYDHANWAGAGLLR